MIATETPVQVFDIDRFEVVDEVLDMSGLKVNRGSVPFLDSHDRTTVDNILGRVVDIRQEDGEIRAAIQFAKDGDRGARAFKLAQDGHLSDVSVGFRISEFETVEPGEKTTIKGVERQAPDNQALRVVTEWNLKEVSAVAVGADTEAKFRGETQTPSTRKEGTTMPEKKDEAREGQEEVSGAPVKTPDEVRRGELQELAKAAGDAITPQMLAEAVLRKDSVDEIRESWLEVVKARREDAVESGPAIHMARTRNDLSQREQGVALALQAGLDPKAIAGALELECGVPDFRRSRRSDYETKYQDVLGKAYELRKATLLTYCEDALRSEGKQVPHTQQDIVRAALSTNALQISFTTSVLASVMRGFNQITDTTAGWTTRVPLANFLTNERVGYDTGGRMARLPPGGVIQHATMSDYSESYKMLRYAKTGTIDEQDLMNDQLNAFARFPAQLGMEAGRVLPDLVYAILMGASLAGPTLNRDGVALFDAAHSNLRTTGSALAQATFKTALTDVRKQTETGVEGHTNHLNLRTTHVLTTPDNEFTLAQILRSAVVREDSGEGDLNTIPVVAGNINPVIDSRLGDDGVVDPRDGTAVAGDDAQYYLVSTDSETMEVGIGPRGDTPGVITEAINGSEGFGVKYTVALDVGAGVLRYQTFHRSSGASA